MLSSMWVPTVVGLVGILGTANAHTVITYPGWRGDNLAVTDDYPFGMQWSYPCGGVPPTKNRTNWSITGGAIAVQPGWFQGHSTALFYINLGLGTDGPGGGPPNMSFPMVPRFEIVGPSDNPYPGTFCLPQVPLPANVSVKVGDLATIQVIETAHKHGASLYNCVDITFSLAEDAPEVNATNCFNSTDISFNYLISKSVADFSSSTMPDNSSSSDTASSTNSRSELFGASSTCAPCPTQTVCPKTNGMPGAREGMGMSEGFGVGLGAGVLALGVFGI